VKVFTSIEELEEAVGADLGVTDWLQIDQARVDAFAAATGDHHWMHVDIPRASAGPYGRTIAHGFLTLSLIPLFSDQLMSVQVPGRRLNYGINAARFPCPVLVGSRLRARAVIVRVPHAPSGHRLTVVYTLEVEGQTKPACVAETVLLLTD
jgi:acyl dehydratase